MMRAGLVASVGVALIAGCASAVTPDLDAATVDSGMAEASVTCPGHPEIEFAPPLSSCTMASDCVAVLHGESCCGDAIWVGVKVTRRGAFDTVETRCRTAVNFEQCDCLAGPIRAQDGRVVPVGSMPSVACVNGECRTSVP